jgi:DNA-binding transcriptional MerR regulator
MPRDFLTTSQLARAAGIHPNTVRLYERWGLISPARRGANGYRQFQPVQVEQLHLVRRVFCCTFVGGEALRQGYAALHSSAGYQFEEALQHARSLLSAVQAEHQRALEAVRYLEAWARGDEPEANPAILRIGEAARLVGSTVDAVRNWERNRLVQARRAANGYRLFGPAEIGRLRVIRLLIHARFGCMAVLRMLTRFEQGLHAELRQALDTPNPDEELLSVTDRWLSALAGAEESARKAVEQAERLLLYAQPPPG